MLNSSTFEKEITERYEKAINPDLLKVQLRKIRDKAEVIRDYYNENLTEKYETVKSVLEKRDRNLKGGNFHSLDEDRGVIEVLDYYVSAIHFGVDDTSLNREFLSHELSKLRKDEIVPPFNYPSINHQLATISQILIDFAESFNLFNINVFTDRNNSKKGGEKSKRLPDPAIDVMKELISKLGHTTIAVDSLFALAEGHKLVYCEGKNKGKAVTKAWIKKHLPKFKVR